MALCFIAPSAALAQPSPTDGTACFLDNPSTDVNGKTYGISSNTGYRTLCKTGKGSCNHKGTDYKTPCGTTIKGPPPGCKYIGSGGNAKTGYGYWASFDCGNGVKVKYNHLQTPNYNQANNTLVTGKTGKGTGCHLDYIITIDGKVVDAQCATGNAKTGRAGYTYGASSRQHGSFCPINGKPNLCDPNVRQQLKDQSDKAWGGKAPGYDVKSGKTTNPPSGGGDTGDTEGEDTGTPDYPSPEPEPPEDPGPIEEPQPPPEETPIDPGDPDSPFNPEASKPRCDNSTCITDPMIENAKHRRVDEDDVKSHLEWILPPGEKPAEDECKDAHETGITVHKQVGGPGGGQLKEYVDAFCTNQGCSYVNEKKEGKGKCELPK